jgi:hypothetical protein
LCVSGVFLEAANRIAELEQLINQIRHDRDVQCERANLLAAVPPTPSFVWLVSNRTTLTVFASSADAEQFMSSFPLSVGGGFDVKRVPVLGVQPPAEPVAAQDRCKHGVRYPHECGDCFNEIDPADVKRWRESETGDSQ